MSEGRNIQIKIAAAGAEQAASEIKKVETAADRLVGGSAGQGLRSLTAENSKVSAASVKMGTGMQNVGYQIQDLAVQIGSGTSAFRALGQQLPQLLSGFGPLGITLGTVSAVALPLAGAMFNLGKASEDAGEKAGEAAGKLEKLTKVRTGRAAAAAEAATKSFLDSLDDETIAFQRQNEEIQRGISLLQAKRRAQAEIDSAEAALELAKIDASDMPDADKIKARAKVQDGLERKKFEGRKAEADERVKGAAADAEKASGEAVLGGGKVDAAKAERDALKKEAAVLRGKIYTANQANGSLPYAEEQARKARVELLGAKRDGEFGSGAARYSPEQIAELEKKVADAEKRKSDLEMVAKGATGAERDRLKALTGDDGKSGEIGKFTKTIEDLAAAAVALEEAARTAKAKSESVKADETATVTGDFKATSLRLEALKITSDAGAVKAVKNDAKAYLGGQEKSAAEAARDRRDGLKDDIDNRQKKLDETARARGRSMRDAGLAHKHDTAASVGKALSDGTSAAEIQKLGDQVREAAGKNGALMTAKLMQVLKELNSQAAEIEKIKAKVSSKSGRDFK